MADGGAIPCSGIIFSAPMVQSIRRGTKRETRRLIGAGTTFVDGAPWTAARFASLDLDNARIEYGPSPAGSAGPYLRAPMRGADTVHRVYPRLSPGMRLWVREGFAIAAATFEAARVEHAAGRADAVLYRADGVKLPAGAKWRSPLLMPRWAARVELVVESVRFERLGDLSVANIRAEGIELPRTPRGDVVVRTQGKNPPSHFLPERAWGEEDLLRAEFASGWNALHPKVGRWEDNPWVVVVRFAVVEGGAR